jgi:hypothetical protein
MVDKFSADDVAASDIAEFGTSSEIQAIGIGDDIVSAGLVPGLSGKKEKLSVLQIW